MSEQTFNFSDPTPMGEVIDFSNVPDVDQPLDPGVYGPAIITKAEKKTSEAGNTYWAFTFEIQPDALEGAGRRLWHNMVITPKSMQFVRRTLTRLGIDITQPVPMVPETFIGRTAILRVTIREWDGEPRNEIKEILAYVPAGDPAKAFL